MGITIQGMAMTRIFFINSIDYYLFHKFQENQKNWQPANFLSFVKLFQWDITFQMSKI